VPELPEVETTCRGIRPALVTRRIANIVVRNRQLRWPVPVGIERKLRNQQVLGVSRRAKYILLATKPGTAILHLGMSGSLRIVNGNPVPEKHDHVDFEMDSGDIIRFNDPRRFGALLWTSSDPLTHPLLAQLGPEPLSDQFSGEYLHSNSRGRSAAIKQHIMNSRIVAGIGNIYASEALFRAGIHPARAAGRISQQRMNKLATEIKAVLTEAISFGGTTLRDFRGGDGKPGYFRNELLVYGRADEPCPRCQQPLRQITLGQRSTFYCVACQR
jgi:formamidopyrimidine-DNA glycosylase